MSLCAILLSYKRPQNINHQLNTMLRLKSVDLFIISNNNPDIDIYEWLAPNLRDHPRIKIINQFKRKHCGERFRIAKALETFDKFICPDDDVFLTEDQYQYILDFQKKHPNRVIGIRGQINVFQKGQPTLRSGISELDTDLDILNCLYAFNRNHLNMYFNLIDTLSKKTKFNDVFVDDILISMSASQRPRCINIGEIMFCATQDDVGIATWKEPGFNEKRIETFERLREQTNFANK